jgi:hypothetical protein
MVYRKVCILLLYSINFLIFSCIVGTLTDPLGCISDRLKVHRPKQRIVEKLLEMGVIQDRKELRKKRVKKSIKNAFPGKLIFIYKQFPNNVVSANSVILMQF